LDKGPADDTTFENNERGTKMSETAGKKSFMDKMSDWMQKYLVPIGMKISNQRHLASIRDGLTVLIPATIIGGIAILIAVPPFPATITEPSNFFYAFLLGWKAFAAANASVLMIPYYMTIGIIAVYVVCGVSYQLATTYKMNGINSMVASLIGLLMRLWRYRYQDSDLEHWQIRCRLYVLGNARRYHHGRDCPLL
jgi:PTS system cellobiose-specific IIC component